MDKYNQVFICLLAEFNSMDVTVFNFWLRSVVLWAAVQLWMLSCPTQRPNTGLSTRAKKPCVQVKCTLLAICQHPFSQFCPRTSIDINNCTLFFLVLQIFLFFFPPTSTFPLPHMLLHFNSGHSEFHALVRVNVALWYSWVPKH